MVINYVIGFVIGVTLTVATFGYLANHYPPRQDTYSLPVSQWKCIATYKDPQMTGKNWGSDIRCAQYARK